MDVTKLVERIPHAKDWRGHESVEAPMTSADLPCHTSCLRCAFDAALAAVPQDTVEAVREAVERHSISTSVAYAVREAKCSCGWEVRAAAHDTTSVVAEANKHVNAAIRSVLAARPVRAVLDAELLIQEWYAVHTSTGMSYINASPTKWFAAYAERLNAALTRQHAEPPAVEEGICIGQDATGVNKATLCMNPEDAAVVELRILSWRKWLASHPWAEQWADEDYVAAYRRVVCGAKP